VFSKDGNSGRSQVPNGTYSPSVQRDRAERLGVNEDKGCDFVGALSDRTYVFP
jgi:hypothetical protein